MTCGREWELRSRRISVRSLQGEALHLPNQCSDSYGWLGEPVELGEDGGWGCSPDERLGLGIVLGEVAVDGGLQVDERVEAATADASACERREERFDRVQ